MMFLIGVFLLLIGIILDEGTSFFLISQGWGVLETNPVYLKFGLIGMIITSILFYTLFIGAWYRLITRFRNLVNKPGLFCKLYDTLIFMLCFVIVMLTFTKVECGFHNINLMVDHMFDEEQKQKIDTYIQDSEIKKVENPVEFKQDKQEYYNQKVVHGLSYLRVIIIILLSYLLFRVNYKVCPYDMY